MNATDAAPTTKPVPQTGALRCLPCLKKGHTCYADRVQDGQAICIWCLDDEPCIWEQRNKKAMATVASLPASQQVSKQEKPMSQAVTSVSTKKANGSASPMRLCKCGCGQDVPVGNRFAFIKGHMKRQSPEPERLGKKCHCGRAAGHTGRHRGANSRVNGKGRDELRKARPGTTRMAKRFDSASPAPIVTSVTEASTSGTELGRVQLQVTEEQLNDFLMKLPLGAKQHLANYYLRNQDGIAL